MPCTARYAIPSVVLPSIVVGLLCAQSAPAAEPARFTVVETQVELAKSQATRGQDMAASLRQASDAEAHLYAAGLTPAIMRIRISGLGYKSAGKGLASNLPMVGMFTGENRNFLKGEVQLVDQATGRPLQRYKIECDDSTAGALGEGLKTYGKVGLSFLPFGSLVTAAMDVAEGAANDRAKAQAMLGRGFVMLSYRKAYGAKLYRSLAPQRQAALQAGPAAAPAPAPVRPEAASAVAAAS